VRSATPVELGDPIDEEKRHRFVCESLPALTRQGKRLERAAGRTIAEAVSAQRYVEAASWGHIRQLAAHSAGEARSPM
jgi:hypothetical protein